jgi:hypothetical protein
MFIGTKLVQTLEEQIRENTISSESGSGLCHVILLIYQFLKTFFFLEILYNG